MFWSLAAHTHIHSRTPHTYETFPLRATEFTNISMPYNECVYIIQYSICIRAKVDHNMIHTRLVLPLRPSSPPLSVRAVGTSNRHTQTQILTQNIRARPRVQNVNQINEMRSYTCYTCMQVRVYCVRLPLWYAMWRIWIHA